MQLQGQTFYNFEIGNWKYFVQNGELVKEKNYDSDYPFSISELCRLINNEYGIDLMNNDYSKSNKNIEYSVERRFETNYKKHCYVVIFQYPPPDEGLNGRKKEIYIDGLTGEILFEDGWTWGDLPKSKTPVPIKGEKEKKTTGVYKINNGISYTRAEWEANEEKEYREYCKRTGKTYIPKNQTNVSKTKASSRQMIQTSAHLNLKKDSGIIY